MNYLKPAAFLFVFFLRFLQKKGALKELKKQQHSQNMEMETSGKKK